MVSGRFHENDKTWSGRCCLLLSLASCLHPGFPVEMFRLSTCVSEHLHYRLKIAIVWISLFLTFSLCRVHNRIQKGFEVFEYYANNQWDFDNTNTHYIRSKLNSVEAKKYKIDGLGMDIMDYFEHCIRAARLHILKESDESIPAAKRHMKMWVFPSRDQFVLLLIICIVFHCRMYCVDKISKTLIIGFFLYFVGGFFLKLIFPSLFSSAADSLL